jgi:hypothetical protein
MIYVLGTQEQCLPFFPLPLVGWITIDAWKCWQVGGVGEEDAEHG